MAEAGPAVKKKGLPMPNAKEMHELGVARQKRMAAQRKAAQQKKLKVLKKAPRVFADDVSVLGDKQLFDLINDGGQPRRLGEGQFGTVFEVFSNHDASKTFAVKVIQKSKLKSAADVALVKNEKKMLSDLAGTAHCLEFFGAFESVTRIFFLMAKARRGSIQSMLNDRADMVAAMEGPNDGLFSEAECQSMMCQILKGVKAIHDLGMLHGDLKPDNILLAAHNTRFRNTEESQFAYLEDCTKLYLVISDYGDAQASPAPNGVQNASPGWDPPEVHHKPVTTAYDMFACGLLLHELLVCQHPWRRDANENAQLAEMIDAEEHSDNSQALIRLMLKKNPAQRCTVDQALAHAWLSGVAAGLWNPGRTAPPRARQLGAARKDRRRRYHGGDYEEDAGQYEHMLAHSRLDELKVENRRLMRERARLQLKLKRAARVVDEALAVAY